MDEPFKIVFIFLFVSTVLSPVSAFWRLLCHGQLGIARIDPLVAPGMISPHVHTAQGARNFGIESTAQELMKSSCTSCEVTQDRSVYWTPPLYFRHDNGSFSLIPQLGGMTVYYFNNNGDAGETITAFPENFSMLAGNAYRRNTTLPNPDIDQSHWVDDGSDSQPDLAQRATGFTCLAYGPGDIEGSLDYHYIRDTTWIMENCPAGFRLELMFPSCWDGVHLDSHDHKSHVQYPQLRNSGPCPEGYPKRMPVLFYETIFNVSSFTGHPGELVLANGDPTGYGYHGDFIAGWDLSVLQEALNFCTDPSGLIEKCPVFVLQNDTVAAACNLTLPEALTDEDVHGPLDSLPGNVPIVGKGPQAPIRPPTPLSFFYEISSTATPLPSNSSNLVTGMLVSSGLATLVPSSASALNQTSATPRPASPEPTVALSTAEAGTSTATSFKMTSWVSDGVENILRVGEVIVTVYATETMEDAGPTKRHIHGHQHGRSF